MIVISEGLNVEEEEEEGEAIEEREIGPEPVEKKENTLESLGYIMSRDRNKRVRELREKKEAKMPTKNERKVAVQQSLEARKEREKQVLEEFSQLLKAKSKSDKK